MENDAISRSAVLEFLTNNIIIREDEIDLMEEVCHTIKVAPSIDVAPVVRCVDCKYRCTIVCPMFHTEYLWDTDDGCDCYDVDRTDDDGFCHLGERRDGEAECPT